MKQLAVVVPALLDHDQRRYHFIDENGRIDGTFLTKKSEKNIIFRSDGTLSPNKRGSQYQMG